MTTQADHFCFFCLVRGNARRLRKCRLQGFSDSDPGWRIAWVCQPCADVRLITDEDEVP